MRDCENCKHRVMKVEVGKGTPPEHFWGCECWECEYEPTTKENLCCDCMDFPNTFDEFANFYGFKDSEEIYTNGSELIPVFRVKQWLEHISTTKNNLGVDCVSREQALRELKESAEHHANDSREEMLLRRDRDILRALPSVTPQEPILDKIRAEIKGMTPTYHNPDWSITDLVSISEVLKLVDKYKAETEVDNGNDD